MCMERTTGQSRGPLPIGNEARDTLNNPSARLNFLCVELQSTDLFRPSLGSEAGLDLDVENALWSLAALYSLGDLSVERFEELSETNRMALSMKGSRSFVMSNSRTQQRSYQHLANGQLPAAHLWTQYRLLESIRSGCLMAELESHAILARIYGQSDEPPQCP